MAKRDPSLNDSPPHQDPASLPRPEESGAGFGAGSIAPTGTTRLRSGTFPNQAHHAKKPAVASFLVSVFGGWRQI